MQVDLSVSDLNKFEKLLKIKDTNIGIADFLNDLVFSNETFPELNKLDSISIKDMVMNHCEMFEYKDVFDKCLKDSFTYVDLNVYQNNPYQKNINITPNTINKYKIEYLSYPPNTFFPYDDIHISQDGYYQEYSRIGISDKEYRYLALSKNNTVWMCITPNEINTMDSAIKASKGKVITFGLGLGYFAYMASLKETVKSITIIEDDLEITNIFKKEILPQFKFKEKINIVSADAFAYLKNNDLKQFDYAFFDMWHNANDGLPILLKIKKMKIKCPCDFWLFESLLALYRRCLISLIEESLSGMHISNYLKAKNSTDRIINDLYFKTQNLKISSYQQIIDLLTDQSLVALMEK